MSSPPICSGLGQIMSRCGVVAAACWHSWRAAWAYLGDFLQKNQNELKYVWVCCCRLTFMYVTISVRHFVSMRGRHIGHASTYHRSAQPVRKAWRGKSCCCDVNKAVVRTRRATLRTSRAVGTVMLASVDNHRGRGGIPPGGATAGRAQIKGHVPRSPLCRMCGVRGYW